MPYDFGDIVLVPFPPASIEEAACSRGQQPRLQHRPARPDRNGVTSQLRPNPGLGEAWITHWQAAGLLKPSVVKPIFATLELRLVLRRLGTLDEDDRATLRKVISEIIG